MASAISPASTALDCSSCARAASTSAASDFLRRLQILLRRQTRRVDGRLAFVEHAAANCFLLGKNFRARLAQRIVVDAQFFLHGRAARFRFLPRAFGPLVALRKHALDGPEKTPAQEEIKKKNDDDCGHSRQEQIAELAKDFHRLFRASDNAQLASSPVNLGYTPALQAILSLNKGVIL